MVGLTKEEGGVISLSSRWDSGTRSPEPTNDVHTRAAEDRLRFALGTKVRIVRRGQGGSIEVDFGTEMELNRIYEFITARSQPAS